MEEILLPQTREGAGFEPIVVRQFTVFLENRVGRLQSLVRALEQSKTRIVALSIEESADSALVRMICSDGDLARHALQDTKFAFAESEVLAVQLSTRTTEPLTALCVALLAAEINIHYAYPFLWQPDGPAVALYVEDRTLAAQLLIRKGFVLIGESDLKRLSPPDGE